MGTRPLRKPLRRIFFAVSRRRASTASSTSDAGTWTVTRRSIWEVVSTETCMDDPLTDLSVLGKREYKRAILRTQPQTGKLCVSVRALHFGLHDTSSRKNPVDNYMRSGYRHSRQRHTENRRGSKKKCNGVDDGRSEEHTSELQSRRQLVCRLLLEKKK